MRSNDLDKQEIIKCFHCGNETPMPKVGEYSWGSRDLEYSDIDFLNKYELFACPVCHMVTLRHSYGDETMIHYHNYDKISYYDEKSILYPPVSYTHLTIGRHIQLALKRLKEEMEVLSHE